MTNRLPIVQDDQAIMEGLKLGWRKFVREHPRGIRIFRVGVTLVDITPADARQFDIPLDDDSKRKKLVPRHIMFGAAVSFAPKAA